MFAAQRETANGWFHEYVVQNGYIPRIEETNWPSTTLQNCSGICASPLSRRLVLPTSDVSPPPARAPRPGFTWMSHTVQRTSTDYRDQSNPVAWVLGHGGDRAPVLLKRAWSHPFSARLTRQTRADGDRKVANTNTATTRRCQNAGGDQEGGAGFATESNPRCRLEQAAPREQRVGV